MANNKLTEKEELKYITYALNGGDPYLKQQAKDDAVKLQSLRAEIDAIEKKHVTMRNIYDFVSNFDHFLFQPTFETLNKELLICERVVSHYAANRDKMLNTYKIMHDNGDLSDKSYEQLKDAELDITNKEFKKINKELKKEVEAVRENAKKMQKADKEKKSGKTTVAKAEYNSEDDNKVLKFKKQGK